MLVIVAMSGLVGFVAGVRVRLVPLIVLAAIVACGAGFAAAAMAMPVWQIALSIVLAVTVFELAAFAALTVRVGLSRSVTEAEKAPAKSAPQPQGGATALR